MAEQFLPVVTMAVQLVAGGAFALSAWHKWQDLDGAEAAILDYRLFPSTARLLAPVLAALEVTAAVGLLLGVAAGALVASALLVIFALAIASALVRGLRIECHCFEGSDPIGVGLVARDLTAAALLLGTVGTSGTWFHAERFDTELPQALGTAFVLATAAAAYGTYRMLAPISADRGRSS